MDKIAHIETIILENGDKGSITFYENKSIKIFWCILPKNVQDNKYAFSNDLIVVKVKFKKLPKNMVVLETFIKPNYDQVSGERQNIDDYYVKIKNVNKPNRIVTPYNKPKETKVNLCNHPSKNGSKHGTKSNIEHIYNGGAMSSK